MQLLILILKKVELMDELLKQLAAHEIKGGTIVDGHGMGAALMDMDDLPIFGSLRAMLGTEGREEAKLLLMAVKDEQVIPASKVIKDVIGDLSKPNTGILLTLPIYYCEGLVDSNAN